MPRLRCYQRRLALLPVAGAQFVGLQSIEHPQDFFGIASDCQIIHRHESHEPIWIHDIRRALGHAFLGVENAERAGQLALDIGQHGERKIAKILVIVAPGQVHKFGIRTASEDLRVTITELLFELAKCSNFRRTDESEILRPEEEHLSLARIIVAGDGLEFASLVAADGSRQGKLWKPLSYS